MYVACTGSTDFSSLNGRPGSDAAFLDLLKAQTGPSLVTGAGAKGKRPTHAQLTKLDLQENDVAKVCLNKKRLWTLSPVTVFTDSSLLQYAPGMAIEPH